MNRPEARGGYGALFLAKAQRPLLKKGRGLSFTDCPLDEREIKR